LLVSVALLEPPDVVRVERAATELEVEETVERGRPTIEALVHRPIEEPPSEREDLRVADLSPIIASVAIV